MVAGRWLMRDRRVETLEAARVIADARQVAATLGTHIAEQTS